MSSNAKTCMVVNEVLDLNDNSILFQKRVVHAAETALSPHAICSWDVKNRLI